MLSDWGKGGGALKSAVGSYFLWGCVSISLKELLLLGGVGRFCCTWEDGEEEEEDFFFMKELKKPVLRSRVNVPISCASSKRLLGDLSRGCCFLGRAGELLDRPSPPNKVEAQPEEGGGNN